MTLSSPRRVRRVLESLVRSDFAPADRAASSADDPLADDLRRLWDVLGTLERPAIVTEHQAAPRRAWAIAAAVLAVGGTAGFFFSAGIQGPGTAAIVVETDRAERRVALLPDGSVVNVGPESRLEVDMRATGRRLRLVHGEALFEVATDRRRPFIVGTPHGSVRAVGTAFNVKLRPREVTVTVVEGRIEVVAGRAPARLIASGRQGDEVRFSQPARASGTRAYIRMTQLADPRQAAAWTRGRLYFRGEPLADVIAEVNRHSRDEVILLDRSLAALPIFGTLDAGRIEGLTALIDFHTRQPADSPAFRVRAALGNSAAASTAVPQSE